MQYPMSASNGEIVSRPESLHSEQTNAPLNGDVERPRKRVRKGTRSCWECKRRKVKCQLSTEDVPVCSGCLARGTNCLSQEYPEERDSSSNGNTHIGERLGRVERLLETLVSKMSSYEEEKSQKILTPESMGDLATPADSLQYTIGESNGSIIGHRDSHHHFPTPGKSTGTRTPSGRGRVPTKIDRLRQALVEVLPSQEDTDLICVAGNCCMLVHSMSSHAANVLSEIQVSDKISSALNIAEISQKHPIIIAQTLLYLAVCLQQLDPEFDTSRLHLYPSIDARMEMYLSTVQTLITSDDELASTMEGLECLLLQGIYYVNAGTPKRAWLNFRKAMNIAQLLGLHKRSSTHPGGRDFWFQLVNGDRYLALLLGLPAGSIDVPFEPEENFQNPEIDPVQLFQRKIAAIGTRIIERNQSENSHAYAATQEIDEQLDRLARDMPASWWAVPQHMPGANEQIQETARHFEKLMAQIYFFQLQALLHLPFMLRAATERRYDYSKFSCLKASREMIWRYLAMRLEKQSFCCRAIDFGALTATVSLFLGTLEHGQPGESRDVTQQRENDRALIHTMLRTMENLARGGRDVVAAQSVSVIKSLLAVDPPAGETAGNLRLTIPYFGTISIVRPAQPTQSSTPAPKHNELHPLSGQQAISMVPGATTQWPQYDYTNASSGNPPAFSFTNTNFPALEPQQAAMGNMSWADSDTVFFDSLLNADIEANWMI